ncbi:MAG: triple tyrosine motif-containing protein [Aquaticitalea sp.]
MKYLKFLLLLSVSCSLFGQELPPINIYTTEDYGADNQNWMISQATNNYIYVANNRGLLEFNGANWKTYTSPNNTIFRAVKVIEDRIYTGCYADFGYWKKNNFGNLDYTSLISNLGNKTLEDEQIWNIIPHNEWVLFQSNKALYFYNTKTEQFRTIPSKNLIYKLFKIESHIYYHVANEGVYRIEEGQPRLIIADSIIASGRVINMFFDKDALILVTRNSGFYRYENGTLIPWDIPANSDVKSTSVFSCIQLSDGSFVLGTISNGILHLTKEGTLKYNITQKTGLSNNTVLSLFEDRAHNLWVGLDNGIDCINVTSPIRTFFDYEGIVGTVYTSQVFRDYLYIGTNQGLFCRKLEDVNSDFKFIKGTSGQVWELFVYNNETLFCGHHLGTFVVEGENATHINNTLGTWAFKPIRQKSDMLIKGNYDGLYVLEKINGIWKVRNKIEGFNNSARYFELNDEHEIWVSHEYKGVFKLKLNDSLSKVESVTLEKNLLLSKNSSLVSYKDDILHASEKGIFKYDENSSSFKKDSILSGLLNREPYSSGKLVNDGANKLWAFSGNNIRYVSTDNITNKPKIHEIPIPLNLRKGVLGYENISLIEDQTYLLGTSNGYITVDLSRIQDKNNYIIHLNEITVADLSDKTTGYDLNKEAQLDYKKGNITFKYSVPEYDKYLEVKYQYQLEGFSNRWSKWSNSTRISFENLSFGDYNFKVRAKIGNEISQNTSSYKFVVRRPWYLSNLAIFLYVLFLLTMGILTHRAYKRYYSKMLKHKQLENEQTIMQIKNEKLNQDIESKNRELAISTMSIIKKNEVLGKIKKELKKTEQKNDNRSAIDLIDTNMNTTKDWKFFKQAFNNADKDFLDKIKSAHPDLTPNDLRFCAYLRLNLSSKEIAPLLNISVKSVETKRYRLRKRLNLEHDDGLVDYILKF